MANDSRRPIRRGMKPAQEPRFDLIGDDLALDFANTVESRDTAEARELLVSYADVVSWSRHSSVLTDGERAALLGSASRDSEAAARAHRRAVELREILFSIFSAIAERRPLPPQCLQGLERFAHDAARAKSLVADGSRAHWSWNVEAEDLERMLWPVVESAVALLTSPLVSRVKMCEGESCARLFLDTSQKQNRRWCDMTLCGNRAKARRHYERLKGVRPGLTGLSHRKDRVRPGLTVKRATHVSPPEAPTTVAAPPIDDRPSHDEAGDSDGFVWM